MTNRACKRFISPHSDLCVKDFKILLVNINEVQQVICIAEQNKANNGFALWKPSNFFVKKMVSWFSTFVIPVKIHIFLCNIQCPAKSIWILEPQLKICKRFCITLGEGKKWCGLYFGSNAMQFRHYLLICFHLKLFVSIFIKDHVTILVWETPSNDPVSELTVRMNKSKQQTISNLFANLFKQLD